MEITAQNESEKGAQYLEMEQECNLLDMYSKQWRIAWSGKTISPGRDNDKPGM
jgi:hypothetical protein